MKFLVLIVLGFATTVLAQSRWHLDPTVSPDVTRLKAIAAAFPKQGRLPDPQINQTPNSFLHPLPSDLDIQRRAPYCFRFSGSDVLSPQAEVSTLKQPLADNVFQEPDCLISVLAPKGMNELRTMNRNLSGDTLVLPASMIRAAEAPRPAEGKTGEKVAWTPLMKQSLSYLGIMHSFRIATEPSTRNAVANPVVGGYFKSLGAMHGWSDGDTYYENYLGHPIEGAVSGYLWIHNDPRYRNVEFGLNPDYWMSRLRAYAFAWAFSEQFEIGLLSEASIGQIQRYCCAYGFVDHVITPNGGALWVAIS